MSAFHPGHIAQSSGPHIPTSITTHSPLTNVTANGAPFAPSDGEEQALESHEVIELQTFSERKAWIEQKIEFLEKLSPIEVFVGMDAVRASAEQIPGLPTRDELEQWIIEHDTIEKETEIFDRGELTKLRQLTKAATQRNLSSADTDVIELTLNTIYALDKLLHLLRDRSENLDLLGIRLDWEEARISAWIDRRRILEDLEAFLEARARWNPSCYDDATQLEETHSLNRRPSVASLASNASDSSSSSQAFSRGIRFKMAEIFSRDAAQLGVRITSLRHGKIAVAGKALDHLIDHSRRPVPDAVLDEQDKLEEKGITELEHLGKFAMGVVMQWRKADEIHIETMKDKTSAQNLYEEIETAKLHHPTARQYTSFASRADVILKRLALRGDPTSPSSTFPRPEHPLFSSQKQFNQILVDSLSAEIHTAAQMARNAEASAKAYGVGYEATRVIETLTASAADLSETFTRILAFLHDGIISDNGDGTPLNLTTEVCLEHSRHAAFLALLPSIIQEHAQAAETSSRILQSSGAAMLNLDHPGIDSTFKENSRLEFERLHCLQTAADQACKDAKVQTDLLREARKMWGVMDTAKKHLEGVVQGISGAIEHARWRQVLSSAQTDLLNRDASPNGVSSHVIESLRRIEQHIVTEIKNPFDMFSQELDPRLNRWFTQVIAELESSLEAAVRMADFLDTIRHQAGVMRSVFGEFRQLQTQIEDATTAMKLQTDRVVSGELVPDMLEAEALATLTTVREKVVHFTNGLPRRIPLIGGHSFVARTRSEHLHWSTLMNNIKLHPPLEVSADVASLDEVVRSDSNAFVMQLNGKIESLAQALSHFRMARVGNEVDICLQTTVSSVDKASHDLSMWKVRLSDIISQETVLLADLQSLLELVEAITQEHQTRASGLFIPLRNVLQKLDAIPGASDLHTARRSAVDYTERRYQAWESDVSAFKDDVFHQQKVERDRLKRLSMEDKQRQEAEKARMAAEEAEQLRRKRDRMAFEEEKRRLEGERKAEELRQQAEKERIAAEEAERARLERERLEAAEKQRLEEERVAYEKRMKLEEERAATQEAEKAILRGERLAVEERLRLVEEELAQERRSIAEKERLAAEALEEQLRARALANKEAKTLACSTAEILEQQVLEGNSAFQVDKSTGTLPLEDITWSRTLAANGVDQPGNAESADRSSPQRLRRNSSPVDEVTTPRAKPPQEIRKFGDLADAFTLRIASPQRSRRTMEMIHLSAQITALRKRLRSISINEVSRPSRPTAPLPDLEQSQKMDAVFATIVSDTARLPVSVPDDSVDAELRSLRSEIEASAHLMQRVKTLADFGEAIRICDSALSDLLEHVDSYPAPPAENLTSPFNPNPRASPEDQLFARLSYTRALVQNMSSKLDGSIRDARTITEKDRILQTWSELEEMATDRLQDKISCPSGAIGPSSTLHPKSLTPTHNKSANNHHIRKNSSYSNLSASTSSAPSKRLLAPPHQSSARRVVSGGAPEPQSQLKRENRPQRDSRPPSQLSTFSSNRSVSGPLSHSVYGSTFSSRQRTTSLSNSTSTPPRRVPVPPLRLRTQTSQDKRTVSPISSETSTYVRTHSRSSTSMSTWSRAPRNSLSSLVPNINNMATTPQRKGPMSRKKYVADPKNKLDVAVGDVVNKLPVAINVEGVSETWKDKSGKYWIGNQDPKLCFCRILRSQTVMVRVGGGWTELSKFIREHFAESFRLLPESPPRLGAKEEKWISSATLLDQGRSATPPDPPRTPEPMVPFVTSFALRTPTRQSPLSAKSSSPSLKGSPLTPMQFIRRADVDSILRPVTPSKPLTRTRNTVAHTHTVNRNSIWRP